MGIRLPAMNYAKEVFRRSLSRSKFNSASNVPKDQIKVFDPDSARRLRCRKDRDRFQSRVDHTVPELQRTLEIQREEKGTVCIGFAVPRVLDLQIEPLPEKTHSFSLGL
ncbi:hypothetical protein CKAN_02389000 [Cinnamomum micranthum f. kanehirae]|uniref:Uncharacterized protein n=1 Tax=Cinnamomum micranthum f. kanehirae TaxID=337451 RepID=A0A443PV00_9MAGN|nr:hypothetical protein CKAN_02389000 [Cinnamomum micranthum f. kanehirae]